MVIPDFLDNLGKPWNLFSTMVYIKVPCYYLAFWTFTISKSYLFKDLGVPYKYQCTVYKYGNHLVHRYTLKNHGIIMFYWTFTTVKSYYSLRTLKLCVNTIVYKYDYSSVLQYISMYHSIIKHFFCCCFFGHLLYQLGNVIQYKGKYQSTLVLPCFIGHLLIYIFSMSEDKVFPRLRSMDLTN